MRFLQVINMSNIIGEKFCHTWVTPPAERALMQFKIPFKYHIFGEIGTF